MVHELAMYPEDYAMSRRAIYCTTSFKLECNRGIEAFSAQIHGGNTWKFGEASPIFFTMSNLLNCSEVSLHPGELVPYVSLLSANNDAGEL